MDKFINRTKKIIFQEQKDILSSAMILSVMIIISRIFGFIRYRTLASFFTKEQLDIFFASFRLPDFVFEMLITGALSSAFIPIFIKYSKNKDELERNISSIINFITISLFILVTIMAVFAGSIIPIITPGFSAEDTELVITLSRILIISQLPLFVIGNILSGMAQANRVFIITAVAPVAYNVGIILGTIFLSPHFNIYGPILGVIGGALMFFLIQTPVTYIIKFNYQFRSFNVKVLKEFITLFVPRTLSILANQIDLTIDLTLSTLLGAGSYTVFYFAQHLQLFPVSFIGMAFGQASLPYISELYKERKIETIRKLFVDSILQLLYLSIPLSLFLIFARTPIVRLAFGGRMFDWVGTNLTAVTVSIFAVTIPFHTIFYFITRSFYATHDTKTPFVINFFCIGLNALLSFTFVVFLKYPVWSLAVSFSIAITINVILLLIMYYKKIHGFDLIKLIKNTFKIYIVAFLSSIGPYIVLKVFDDLIFDTARTINVFVLLTITFALFSGCYLFLSWLFNIEEIYVLGKLMIKVKALRKKITELYTDTG